MGGDRMSSRNLFASSLMACLLAVGFLGVAPAASATVAGKSFLKSGESARNLIKVNRRSSGPRLYSRIAPSYIYYDYPYYYSRGYYPTHIEPGFLYYGYPYHYYRKHYRGPASSSRVKARKK
jgi:hypothetical protein